MTLRQSQALLDALDFNEMDMLFDLELEEQRLRIAARRVRANRKLEDVNYWRQRSGWYDDDASMMEYNNGVYNSYYSIDDDYGDDSTSSSSSSSAGTGFSSDIMSTALTICGALVGIVVLVMLVQAITRGSARRKVANGDSSTNRSKRGTSRHRSKSKTRSRSSKRTREGVGSSAAGEGGNYNLMEEKKSKEKKSKASSSKPRSKSKGKSRSKSRPRQGSRRQEMLV